MAALTTHSWIAEIGVIFVDGASLKFWFVLRVRILLALTVIEFAFAHLQRVLLRVLIIRKEQIGYELFVVDISIIVQIVILINCFHILHLLESLRECQQPHHIWLWPWRSPIYSGNRYCRDRKTWKTYTERYPGLFLKMLCSRVCFWVRPRN